METRFCIEYVNPRHPLRDNGSINVRYDRVLTLEQAEHDLTLILSFGAKILNLYMGNAADGKTGEWNPIPMIVDKDDWFTTDCLEQKSAWSQEDEKCIKNILWCLNGNALGVDYMDRCKNWLEHIKDRVQPQSHWKPSDEQMKALTFACIKNVGIDKSSIKALYDLKEQLKQL